MITYTALFLAEKDRLPSKLAKTIECQHITHQYRPAVIPTRFFGQTAKIRVTGYGINANNEGFKVEIVEASEELRKAFENVELPHITTGISKSGKAVNTRFLDFAEIEPFELTVTYGGFENGKIIF